MGGEGSGSLIGDALLELVLDWAGVPKYCVPGDDALEAGGEPGREADLARLLLHSPGWRRLFKSGWPGRFRLDPEGCNDICNLWDE